MYLIGDMIVGKGSLPNQKTHREKSQQNKNVNISLPWPKICGNSTCWNHLEARCQRRVILRRVEIGWDHIWGEVIVYTQKSGKEHTFLIQIKRINTSWEVYYKKQTPNKQNATRRREKDLIFYKYRPS